MLVAPEGRPNGTAHSPTVQMFSSLLGIVLFESSFSCLVFPLPPFPVPNEAGPTDSHVRTETRLPCEFFFLSPSH